MATRLVDMKKEQVKEQNDFRRDVQEECRHDHRPDKAQRTVISAPPFFWLLKIENTLFKITEFNFLFSLPPTGRGKASAK